MQKDNSFKCLLFLQEMNLRMIAFIVFVVGMFLMFVLLFVPARVVYGPDGLNGLELNSRVEVSGIVVNERVIYEGTKLVVVNGIDMIVEGEEGFRGRQITVRGRISEYEGERQVVAEEVLF